MSKRFSCISVLSVFLFMLTACTTTDPYTGEQKVDSANTAAMVGGLALLGAVAYAASKDDDDDNDDDSGDWDYDDRVWHPQENITCYDYRRACYKRNGQYSSKWTNRIY